MGAFSITPSAAFRKFALGRNLVIIDVRRQAVFEGARHRLPRARWRAHMEVDRWEAECRGAEATLVYCAHGHNVSQLAVADLRGRGVPAMALEGGIDAWTAEGLPLVAASPHVSGSGPAPSRWVTRTRPKIDRIACPWFVRRFVDADARFLFTDPAHVLEVAGEMGAVSFDIDGANFTHDGPRCTFDSLLDHFDLSHEPLRFLAEIVRGADTADVALAPEAAGLLAVSLGISARSGDDDHAALRDGFAVYDALYAWACLARGETHNWPAPPR